MQSALDTDGVLDARRELEAIEESSNSETETETVNITESAIQALDDIFRDKENAESHYKRAKQLIIDLKHEQHDGPFYKYACRAEESLSDAELPE